MSENVAGTAEETAAARNRQAEILDSAALPLLWDGASVGTVEAVREGLYLRFRAEVRISALEKEKRRAGLWRVRLAGEGGEARLGTLEPSGGGLRLTRRLSARSLAPLGRLLRGEVRPASEDGGHAEEPLSALSGTAEPSPAPDGTPSGGEAQAPAPDILPRPGGGVLLAYPADGPFPLPSLFCFARLDRDGQRWLFPFDNLGRPVF